MNRYKQLIIGCDNGCTGTLSVFGDGKLIDFIEQFSFKWRKPHVKSRNSYMSRIDFPKFHNWLSSLKMKSDSTIAVIERPMTDESRFQQTISSHHAQEAVMIALELVNIPFMTVNSFEWQKIYLPDISGSAVLKMKCTELAAKEFPKYCRLIKKHGDADAIYIAKSVVDGKLKFVSDSEKPLAKPKIKKTKIFITNFGEKI